MEAFAPWLERWELEADGWPFGTPYTRSLLLPVRRDGRAAMLKLAGNAEEARGGALMAWWAGGGAAPVLAQDGPALLMARAADPDALPRMAFQGRETEAIAILCETAAALHGHAGEPPCELVPLRRWFRALEQRAAEGGLFGAAWAVAQPLLETPRDVVVLHGDITHANVLDFGADGWRAIDPKALRGERGYDYANLFRSPTVAMATPERLQRQLGEVAALAGLERERLLGWVIAHAALAAAWYAEDGGDVARALPFVTMALAQSAA
ncbi:hypothetical protein DJ017_11580 [Phenylobacterium soli]|uniref:Uncharacterized protein n=1 Tax=Phenylobacterium soli TaxID=2170551 RepID=A0A328APS9_9CAUL|nr:hypothetical protein DJ017_11580 [Phenylobacterium soli]